MNKPYHSSTGGLPVHSIKVLVVFVAGPVRLVCRTYVVIIWVYDVECSSAFDQAEV